MSILFWLRIWLKDKKSPGDKLIDLKSIKISRLFFLIKDSIILTLLLLERNIFNGSLGKTTPRTGMKSVTGALPTEMRASATEGDAITILGVAYTIRIVQDDGTGMTTFVLEKN